MLLGREQAAAFDGIVRAIDDTRLPRRVRVGGDAAAVELEVFAGRCALASDPDANARSLARALLLAAPDASYDVVGSWNRSRLPSVGGLDLWLAANQVEDASLPRPLPALLDLAQEAWVFTEDPGGALRPVRAPGSSGRSLRQADAVVAQLAELRHVCSRLDDDVHVVWLTAGDTNWLATWIGAFAGMLSLEPQRLGAAHRALAGGAR